MLVEPSPCSRGVRLVSEGSARGLSRGSHRCCAPRCSHWQVTFQPWAGLSRQSLEFDVHGSRCLPCGPTLFAQVVDSRVPLQADRPCFLFCFRRSLVSMAKAPKMAHAVRYIAKKLESHPVNFSNKLSALGISTGIHHFSRGFLWKSNQLDVAVQQAGIHPPLWSIMSCQFVLKGV